MNTLVRIIALAVGTAFVSPAVALTDCQSDIDKVEYAIDKLGESNIDATTAEKMRALLDEANKAKKDENEPQCQELINQAKYIGNVD